MDYKSIRGGLEKAGVVFESGLTAQEFKSIENHYNLHFPPDLKEFLSLGLPVSDNWVNWRENNEKVILERLNWPWEGLVFDIQNNDLWQESWGKKPESINDRLQSLKALYEKAPKLIPIFSHRYIPDSPQEVDNPIFSVWQSDIIYYGCNLENYFHCEFHKAFNLSENNQNTELPFKSIDFWTDIVENYE